MARDVTGTYDGYEVDLFGSYYTKTNNIYQFGVSTGVRYRDKKRSNYLYGVDKSEVNNNLNAYTADDGWATFLSSGYSRQFTKNLSFLVDTSITSLSKTAQSSPRIKDNTN